jgi:hypothetical protein
MMELKYTMNYGSVLTDTISKFPEILEGSRSVFEGVAKSVRGELDGDGGVLIHGDFWSGKYAAPYFPHTLNDINKTIQYPPPRHPHPRSRNPHKTLHHRLGALPRRISSTGSRTNVRRAFRAEAFQEYRCRGLVD